VTSGWACPQCSNVMAPFIVSCPFCTKAAGSAVPGFRAGDRAWPKADGPMALQRAPQTVLASRRDPVFGDWLWLDGGSGHFGSWSAGHWTTDEPGDAEKAEITERARRRAEENDRMTPRRSHSLTFGGGLAGISEPGDRSPGMPPPGYVGLPLPSALTPGAEYRLMVGGNWAEILPDLECRMVRAIWACAPDGKPVGVDLEFRRTPQAAGDSKGD